MSNGVKFILGKKLNMSQVFTVEGAKIPVTVISAGPCKVVQVKTADKDGYASVQIGFGRRKHVTKPQAGHQKGDKFMFVREFRVADPSEFKLGQEITASQFESGEYVDASGIMKGRGTAGAMKRHGFHGMPMSHGHNRPRSVGSIGSRFPQHTLKGTRMAGRMGGHQVTVKNLIIVDIDAERNLLWVKGAVPGSRNGLIKLVTTGKKLAVAPVLFTVSEPKTGAKSEPETKASETESAETPKVESKE